MPCSTGPCCSYAVKVWFAIKTGVLFYLDIHVLMSFKYKLALLTNVYNIHVQ